MFISTFQKIKLNECINSPGDARYTCYRYSISLGILLLMHYPDLSQTCRLSWSYDDLFKIDGEPVTGLPGDSWTVLAIKCKY